MRADEVGDDLLAQAAVVVDAVELPLEVVEEAEGGFAHQLQHTVAGVLWGHLKASADVPRDELARVVGGSAVEGFVAPVVEQQVVAHAAADVAVFDAGQGIYGTVDIEQRTVVAIEVGTDGGMDTRGPAALTARVEVLAPHGVHVR